MALQKRANPLMVKNTITVYFFAILVLALRYYCVDLPLRQRYPGQVARPHAERFQMKPQFHLD